jgi:hypothetical protein
MSSPRRVYIYLVSAISLQAVTWALISLIRNLLLSDLNPDTIAIAFQIAIIVIGLPVFLAHWLWGRRLAQRDIDERRATFRRLFLYGMQAMFLIPIVDSSFAIVGNVIGLVTGETLRVGHRALSTGESILFYLIAVVVLAVLWYYLHLINQQDAQTVPESGSAAVVRRANFLGFSGAGLAMTTVASISLLQWLLFQFGGGGTVAAPSNVRVLYELARLAIGVPLWLIFWGQCQRLFAGPNEEERESSLRKFYLYFTVLAAVLSAVTSAGLILEGWFKQLLLVSSTGGGGDVRIPLSIILGMAVLWAYHANILSRDAKSSDEAPRQARIRRVYSYLVAAVGLSAFVIGIAGDVSVFIRSLDEAVISSGLKSQLAGSTAALIAGLPVWFMPWRGAQLQATAKSELGAEERRSVVRKIYLYYFLLIATLTVLSSVVFIVFRLLSAALGLDPPTISELGLAIAFSAIAVGVWLYHGSVLRADGKQMDQDQREHLKGIQVAVVDPGDGAVGRQIIDELSRRIPGLSTVQLELTETDVSEAEAQKKIIGELGEAGVIVGPWSIAVAGGSVTPGMAKAVTSNPARKLLYPTWTEGWDWAGIDRTDTEAIVRQSVDGVKQILAGEMVKPSRPLGIGAIIGIIVAVLLLLGLLSIPLIVFMYGF